MRPKGLIIVAFVAIFPMLNNDRGVAQPQNHEQLNSFYENCILNKIDKCQSKMILLKTTRSKNLQQAAEKAKEQYRFLLLNKNALIDEMHEQRIGQKNYKVERYLNRRFYETY